MLDFWISSRIGLQILDLLGSLNELFKFIELLDVTQKLLVISWH